MFCSSIMLLLGIVLCPMLLVIVSFGFFGLVIVKIRSQLIEAHQWRSTPCPHCIYFTNCPELKCAVHPHRVLTNKAVNCRDFELIKL